MPVAVPSVADVVAAPGCAGMAVEFTDAGGTSRFQRLGSCWDERFENVAPAREFRWAFGQRHFPGWWWLATTGEHVGYESWLERDVLMALDFDREVVAVVSQPFWLCWHDGQRQRRHCPDYFARLADGSALVVDVRPDDQIPARDAETFAVTAAACAGVGWGYRRTGAADPVVTANLRWLAGYRHQRCRDDGLAARLAEVFACPAGLLEGARSAGEQLAVLPVLYHLLWTGELVTDLAAAPLEWDSLVAVAGAGR